jgi:nonsense-mediated mRNA decay protein 3
VWKAGSPCVPLSLFYPPKPCPPHNPHIYEQQVKLVDAGFIWTEPHSRRLKVKLSIQREVFNGAILQQTFVVDFVVETNMCIDCNRANTNIDVWRASVQVRDWVEKGV